MRTYVLNPYQMVKDVRTGYETGNAASVLDGEIDAFIEAGIRWMRQRVPSPRGPAAGSRVSHRVSVAKCRASRSTQDQRQDGGDDQLRVTTQCWWWNLIPGSPAGGAVGLLPPVRHSGADQVVAAIGTPRRPAAPALAVM